MPCKNHPLVEDRLTRCCRCAEAFCPDCIVEIGGLPYCLGCKTESMRDLRSGVVLHELDLATLGRRFLASFIDGLIIMVPAVMVIVAVLIPFGFFEDENPFLGLFIQLVLSLFIGAIYVVYEGMMLSAGGQTVGKRAMSIKVVTPEGGEITRGQAWGRAGARQLIALFCWPIDYVVALGQERTTIHDMMARTRVVNWE